MTRRTNILIVDDEVALSRLLQSDLSEGSYYTVNLASDGAEAINCLQEQVYDVVLLDIKMPRVSGIEVLKFIKEYSPSTQVIMLTNYADVKTAIETTKLGAYDFLSKPYDYDELIATIERAIERKQLTIDNTLMRSELSRKTGVSGIVGKSKAIIDVIENAKKIAQSDSYVLIQGESGTGKELIAQLVHQYSQRSELPFVPVNCASIPDALLESELFGHEKGAFTNAYQMKQGLVEVANGGTLFLDEVGDISPTIQPKLLRFLETGEFRRVGATVTRRVAVRVVSATNKDLAAESEAGRFRNDLLYRLNVVQIRVPPLRDRIQDIPLLVEHFLKVKAKSKVEISISLEAMSALMKYDWPGNVRELEHVIEGAMILSHANVIQTGDLLPNMRRQEQRIQTSQSAANDQKTLEELEKEHIIRILETNKWNRGKTAEILGITPKTLYLKIKRFKLVEPS
jgi:two-component system, NtrC family, response regulator AtoC